MRTRFQGIRNVVRFNWHLYLAAGAVILLAFTLASLWQGPGRWLWMAGATLAFLQIVISLTVSHLVYDRSEVYSLPLLEERSWPAHPVVVNIHAGFDESSDYLKGRFSGAELLVWDFFNPLHHPEPSIRRARNAHPPSADQVAIATDRLPLATGSADLVCLVFSAHEIRSRDEQVRFFTEIARILKSDGRACVVEHLRDFPNGLAFGIGFLHFHPRSRWMAVFREAGFSVERERKDTAFTTAFLLRTART